MGEINLTTREKDALSKLDPGTLAKAIDHTIDNEKLDELYPLGLSNCGAYVAGQYSAFQRAMAYHKKSKASKKWEETHTALRRAGFNLKCALDQMRHRMAEEEEEGKLFRIHDDVHHPVYVSARMDVTIRYQWRRADGDQWNHGSITFNHVAESPPDYRVPGTKRKPSAAKQREEREEKLRREWEHLMRGALFSMQSYFREGRDGAAIPANFRVTVDRYSRCLNNRSAEFWLQPSAHDP